MLETLRKQLFNLFAEHYVSTTNDQDHDEYNTRSEFYVYLTTAKNYIPQLASLTSDQLGELLSTTESELAIHYHKSYLALQALLHGAVEDAYPYIKYKDSNSIVRSVSELEDLSNTRYGFVVKHLYEDR